MRRKCVLLAAAAASFVVVAVAAPVASADYGNTAQYQAAISFNCDNKTAFFCTNVVGLGGVWSWFAFNNDGTFDSTETFCAHNDPVFGSGAFHFNGDGNWQVGPVGPSAPPFGQQADDGHDVEPEKRQVDYVLAAVDGADNAPGNPLRLRP